MLGQPRSTQRYDPVSSDHERLLTEEIVANTGLIVSYIDANNSVNLTWQSSPPTTTPGWGFEFLTGNGPLLQPGERVEITVNLSGLTTPLGTGQEFTIEVKPSLGAVLAISKKTPGEFTTVVSLD